MPFPKEGRERQSPSQAALHSIPWPFVVSQLSLRRGKVFIPFCAIDRSRHGVLRAFPPLPVVWEVEPQQQARLGWSLVSEDPTRGTAGIARSYRNGAPTLKKPLKPQNPQRQ